MFNRRTEPDIPEHGTVLLLQIPRTNEKKELAAEQMFASLHGLLADNKLRQRISFEIAVKNRRIGFYVWVPDHLKSFVEEQIYAQYPDVHITEVPDYIEIDPSPGTVLLGAELKLTAHEALPIKHFRALKLTHWLLLLLPWRNLKITRKLGYKSSLSRLTIPGTKRANAMLVVSGLVTHGQT